jgi:hypothetical protein
MNLISAAPLALSAHPPNTGPVTRDQVHIRTRELALISGRGPLQVMQTDYDQARRELTGESDDELQEAVLGIIPGPCRPAHAKGHPPFTRD